MGFEHGTTGRGWRNYRDGARDPSCRCASRPAYGRPWGWTILRPSTKTARLDSFEYIHNSRYMESENAILALAALAQSTRLEVFRLLVKREPEGLAAGDIANALAVPQNTMSSHLSILSRAGLLSAQRFGRSIVYRADLKHLRTVMLFMLRDCCDAAGNLRAADRRPPGNRRRCRVRLCASDEE